MSPKGGAESPWLRGLRGVRIFVTIIKEDLIRYLSNQSIMARNLDGLYDYGLYFDCVFPDRFW